MNNKKEQLQICLKENVSQFLMFYMDLLVQEKQLH